MRGFSKAHQQAPRERAFAEDAETLRIARIFSPKRPEVVVSNEAPAPRASQDELAMLFNLAGKNFALGFRCLWMIRRLITVRLRLRLKVAYHRIMQARKLPWALAGAGMPGWAAFILTEMVR
jgi:hypothetical protein